MSTIQEPGPIIVEYPDSDGKPMSDNTVQFRWISLIMWNLDHQYATRPDVFVAGDHLIYPIKGDASTRQAPDVYVAFGPRKKDRGSYRVWEEGGVFPQVVFEVWSPNNQATEMDAKREFYERHGAEEYYLIYPDFPCHIVGWKREGKQLVNISQMDGWVSPRLGIQFGLKPTEVSITGPNGKRFQTPTEIAAERAAAEQLAAAESARADEQAKLAKAERDRADEQACLAKVERDRADEQARQTEEQARKTAAEHARADKLAARLRELGIDPDAE